jgi:hypothetical protein
MKIALYFDEDSQDYSLIRALRSRGVDVIAASEAGMNGRTDDEQLQCPRLTPVSCSVATLVISIRGRVASELALLHARSTGTPTQPSRSTPCHLTPKLLVDNIRAMAVHS